MLKHKTSLINLVFLIITFNISVKAQKITSEWTNFYTNKEYGSRLVTSSYVNDSNGNSYIVGQSVNERSCSDIFLLALNNNGDTIFNKIYDNRLYPGSRDIAQEIHLDSSGNIVIVGRTQWNDNIYGDPLILKYNKNGDLLWSTIHQPQKLLLSQSTKSTIGASDTIYLINKDTLGKYYIEKIDPEGNCVNTVLLEKENTEYNYYTDSSTKQLYLFNSNKIKKLDFNGNELWDYSELFKHKIELLGIEVDAKQNCYLYGGDFNNNGVYSYYVIKLSADGLFLWEKKVLSTAYTSVCKKAIVDIQGGITIAYQNNSQTLIGDIHILNINSSGTQTKEFDIKLSSQDGRWKDFKDICYDKNGNLCYAVLNCSEHPIYNSSIKKIEIGKYTPLGTLIWNKKFDDTSQTGFTTPFILTNDQLNNLKLTYNHEFSRNTDLSYITDGESRFVSFSETGEVITNNSLKSEGYSKITAHSITYNSKNCYTAFCESNLGSYETKFIAIQYDSEGNKLWEYNYLHPNNYNLEHVKTYTLTNGFIKLLFDVRGIEDGENVSKYIVITLDNEGKEHLKTELDIPYNNFTASNCYNNHYYLEYWQNNTPYLTCYNAEDKIEWTQILNDGSFIDDAEIQGTDKDDNLYLYASGNLSKVDTTGNILWTTNIGDVDHTDGKIILDKDDNVYFYRNEEPNYSYNFLGLYKLSESGELAWSFKSDTIRNNFIVWPRSDGGISVFGGLMDYLYDNSSDLCTMMSLNKDGIQESRIDINVYPYKISSAICNDYLYIIHENGMLLFDKKGKYLASPVFDNLSYATAKTKTKQIIFDNDHNAIAQNQISDTRFFNQDWSIMALSKFNTQFLDNQENSAPYFVNMEDTVYNTIYSENYSIKAIDDEGDPILYTLIYDDSNGYKINARSGYITSLFSSSSPQRGIHNLIIRAIDPHGAYSDLKKVIYIGPDNKPFFISKPITTCRVGSKYNYTPIVIDENNDHLNYSLLNNNLNWLSIDENTGQLSGTPPEYTQNTTAIITIDAYEETFDHHIQQSFNLVIEEQNTAPTITQINTTANLNQEYSQELKYSDAENDSCVWQVLEKPYWLNFNEKTNTIFGTPTKSDFYSDGTLTLQLTDNYMGTTNMTFQIKIEYPENLAPIFNSEPIQQAYNNLEYYYKLDAYDPNGDEISYQLNVSPPFINLINDSILIGTPTEFDENNEQYIIIQATDYYGKSSQQEYNITISPKADKPNEHPFDLQYVINKEKAELEIILTNLTSSFVSINIVNFRGNTITEYLNPNISNGKVSQLVDTTDWPKGEYTLCVSVNEKKMIKKITIN